MKNKQIGRVTPEQWQQLEETLAGVIPPNCRRMVVDIGHPGEPSTVYWECYADAEVIKIAFDVAIAIGRTTKGGE
jgi:hypothetical protein